MIVRVRCQHCGQYSMVEDMGDNAVCAFCKKFIISISEYMRASINGEQGG